MDHLPKIYLCQCGWFGIADETINKERCPECLSQLMNGSQPIELSEVWLEVYEILPRVGGEG